MSRLNINNLTNENEDGSPKISGISTFSSTAFLETPKGTTAERPSHADAGMIRFNTDSGHLEYYNGVEWTSVAVNNNKLDGGARGVFAGAYAPGRSDTIEYITISTLGNSLDFGNLVGGTTGGGAGTNDRTRGWHLGGNPSSYTNQMQYITIASTGNSIDAGNLSTTAGTKPGAVSSSTRGIIAGGLNPAFLSTIQYHTIQSTGDSVTFGDLSAPRRGIGGVMSSTRGVFCGGAEPGSPAAIFVDTLEFITISTTGDAVNFGELSLEDRANMGSCSNSTRGILAGGRTPADTSHIEFLTIATTGNSQDFGDLAQSGLDGDVGAVASPTRAVISGGGSNVIAYVTIASTGDSLDFGDLTQNSTASQDAVCISNGHGGL